MDRVLVATDGSPAARAAVEAGIQLAIDEGAALDFVHVVSAGDWVTEGGISDEDADQPLEQASARARARGLESVLELIPAERSVADEIVDYANSIDADLIVVGSGSHGRLVSRLLGSVCRRVVGDAGRPVLIVHQSDTLDS